MYAIINLPGSIHFDWHGPDTQQGCEKWLRETVEKRQRTELITSLLPQQVISNRAAAQWRYRDGNHVFP